MSSICDSEAIPEAVADATTRPTLLPRILILDDDAAAWASIVRSMRQRGLGVLVSSANQSAIELVAACEAEVVIVEARSPADGALTLLSKIKATSPDTAVIFTTGEMSLDETISAYRSGAFDVVRRPLQPCELGPAVSRAMERRQRARDSSALVREGQRLLSIRERERLPAVAVDFAQRAMRADVVSLMLRDSGGGLYIAHASGLPQEVLAGTRLQIGQRIAGRVAELRTPLLMDDALFHDERFEDLIPFGRVRSSIVYPLLSSERTLGILNIGRSAADQPFGAPDLERAGVVASQVSLAFETLRHWQRTGMTDRLAIMGELASSVSHELNNPLAAVVGQSELGLESIERILERLASGVALDANALRAAVSDVRLCLEEARSAAVSVQHVASDLRAAVQGHGTHESLSDVSEVVRAACRLATAELRRRTVLSKNVEPRLFVACDSGLLCHVFLNLIVNANQAMRAAATLTPEITIVSTRLGAEVRIDVVDNGPGIAPHDLPRAFEPFFVGLSSAPGRGLGLSIAHDIVQSLGGRLEVSSKLGEGTVFSVYLPIAGMSAPARPCGRADELRSGSAP